MRRRKSLVVLCVIMGFLMATVGAASAITKGGALDADDHPYVGLMIAKDADGNPLWRCTGSLISPTVYVTAGHCTESPAASAEIWFETDLESQLAELGYPFGGPTSVSGTTYTYPAYNPAAFFIADLGVVELDEPVTMPRYAQLPDEGYVDTLPTGRKGAEVTVVGYGLQAATSDAAGAIHPDKTQADRIRYRADVMIVNTKGVAGQRANGGNSMFISGDAKHGGTCSGDSGGPTLDGDTLLAVTSYGFTVNCKGVGGVYRVDSAEALSWIRSFG